MNPMLESALTRLDVFERDTTTGDLESAFIELREGVTGMLNALLHLTRCRKPKDECEDNDHVVAEDAEWWRDGSRPGARFPTPGVPAMLDTVENLTDRLMRGAR